MKVAVVTDDGKTISQHFGTAETYIVYEIQDSKIRQKETRPKAHLSMGAMQHQDEDPTRHHLNPQMKSLHRQMLSNLGDCQALIARSMGRPMYEAIRRSGIKPFLTDRLLADDAVQAYTRGILDNHAENIHG